MFDTVLPESARRALAVLADQQLLPSETYLAGERRLRCSWVIAYHLILIFLLRLILMCLKH